MGFWIHLYTPAGLSSVEFRGIMAALILHALHRSEARIYYYLGYTVRVKYGITIVWEEVTCQCASQANELWFAKFNKLLV